MTISNTKSQESYTATQGQTVFEYPFQILDQTNLRVYQNESLITAYTVNGVGDAEGGTITLLTGATVGDIIRVQRNMPITQEVDYHEGSKFPADVHEGALDKLTMVAQELDLRVQRAFKVPESSPITNPTLPTPVGGQYLRWNQGGTGLENSTAVVDAGSMVQSGSGSVVRTVTGKVGEIVSVADFGASPDKTASQNTEAFQYAIAAARYKLVIPEGEYHLNGFTIDRRTASGIWLCGHGTNTRLFFDTTGDCIKLTCDWSPDSKWTQDRMYRISDMRFYTENNVPTSIIKNEAPINTQLRDLHFIGGTTEINAVGRGSTAPSTYVKADYCVDQLGGYGLTMRDCIFCGVKGKAMVRFRQNPADNNNYSILNKVEDCDFSAGAYDTTSIEYTGTALELEGGVNTKISGSCFQLLDKAIVACTRRPSTDMINLSISDTWFEQNKGWDLECQSDYQITGVWSHREVHATFFNCSFAAPYSGKIKLGQKTKLALIGCGSSVVRLYTDYTTGGGTSKVTRLNSPNVSLVPVTQTIPPGGVGDGTALPIQYKDIWLDLDSQWGQPGFCSGTFKSSNNNASIGNGTTSGHWFRYPGGMARLDLKLNVGSTTNFGTGYIQLGESTFLDNFPSVLNVSNWMEMGQVMYFRASTGMVYSGYCQFSTGRNNLIELWAHGVAGQIGSTPPWGGSWANGDECRLTMHYQCGQAA